MSKYYYSTESFILDLLCLNIISLLSTSPYLLIIFVFRLFQHVRLISSCGIIIYKGDEKFLQEFNLTDDEIQRLQIKFMEFKKDREKVHELLIDYIADYRQFEGTSTERYEHLQRKFISKAPNLSHLVSIDGSFLWSVNDISIILGRHRTTIQRTLDKLEISEGWCAKLLALRETSKAPSGLKIYVYHKEIFDLILDLYEEEYLLRFSEPRHGNIETAPDLNEVRRFWNYLKDYYSVNDFAIYNEKKLDIPPMTLKDILSLIWEKVFNIKIGTLCSVIFAVCFEIARRFFGVNIWIAIVPALVSVVCIILIYNRKFSPDTLSNLSAGALLFTLLWISASFSVDSIKPEQEKIIPRLELTPVLADNYNINFNIQSNVENAKEYFYRISPDKDFRSAGFIRKIKSNKNVSAPSTVIINGQLDGIADIDVKFLDDDSNESSVWHFAVDINSERFKLYKQSILNSEATWIYASYHNFDDTTRIRLDRLLFSPIARDCIDEVIYSINNSSLNVKLNYSHYYQLYKKGNVFDPYTISEIDGKGADINSIFSQVIFKDGSSSDVRIYNFH